MEYWIIGALVKSSASITHTMVIKAASNEGNNPLGLYMPMLLITSLVKFRPCTNPLPGSLGSRCSSFGLSYSSNLQIPKGSWLIRNQTHHNTTKTKFCHLTDFSVPPRNEKLSLKTGPNGKGKLMLLNTRMHFPSKQNKRHCPPNGILMRSWATAWPTF